MRFGNANARHRDDFITATFTRSYTNPRDAYNQGPTGDGRLKAVTAEQTTTIEFAGMITDMKSETQVGGGKRRGTRMISIMCDARVVEDLTEDFTLTYEGSTDVFQVEDIFDTEFRFTSEVIARYIQ